jgi:hypothetical protein
MVQTAYRAVKKFPARCKWARFARGNNSQQKMRLEPDAQRLASDLIRDGHRRSENIMRPPRNRRGKRIQSEPIALE